MAVRKTAKPASPAAKPAPIAKAKITGPAGRKSAGNAKTAAAKPVKSASKIVAKPPGKKLAPAAKKSPAKTKAPAAKSKKRTLKAQPESAPGIDAEVLDPIGDVTSGEARSDLSDAEPLPEQGRAARTEPNADPQGELEAFLEETRIDASDADLEAGPGIDAARAALQKRARKQAGKKAQARAGQPGMDVAETETGEREEAEPAVEPREPAKIERLQKILSKAGIASRRTAEEMIAAGRVMVNGTVVTQLGSKADPARDHIRVDGKLLHGAERHRYFVLNKPRGYVTTMSDPEGRPTVMEFFAGSRERVYPVGRLDYLSEGLLLMTNDGELANLLTKAGSGVEKTYLVKVAGQSTTEELERLRGGVAIEKGEPGSERVRTAPARIRPFREGDNPWFEVTLIEGRNRELRKMFGAIGHFAEKIRRVGYGPLVLDLEPGKMRELDEEEVHKLRLAAEGKLKPRRVQGGKMLPGEAGSQAVQQPERRGDKIFGRRPSRPFDRAPQGEGPRRTERGDRRPPRPETGGEKPRWRQQERGPKREWQPREGQSSGAPRNRTEFRGAPKSRPEFRGPRPFGREGSRPEGSGRPPFKPGPGRPEFRPRPAGERGENRAANPRRESFNPRSERPALRGSSQQERGDNRFSSASQRPFKPPFKPRSDRPPFRSGPPQERGARPFGSAPRPPFRPRGEFKPRFEGQHSAGSEKSSGFGGKPKPQFSGKPGFGGKSGGFGRSRDQGGGAKRGFSRPGAPRSGWKRG